MSVCVCEWMEAVTMVAFQVNKQWRRVCLNVPVCPAWTEAECTFGRLSVALSLATTR